MSMNMPEPVAAYFAADKLDGAAVARCFTKDAVVKDEAHMYAGAACIERWKTEASAKYHYTCEPFRSEQKDGVIEVTCHLTGNFPGSPINLRYLFRLQRGKIASLEIRP